MSTGGLGTVNWFIMSYHSTYNHWTLHHYHWVMVTGLTLCCHLTWLTTERWALPWTVGEQLPGVSSCRIGSEWQCGNTGNTGNPWQGQTKSWEAARAQGPAPAMGSLGLCPLSGPGLNTSPASGDSGQARAASSMWPGVRGLVSQSALWAHVTMSHYTAWTMRLHDHWPPSWWCLLL